MDAASARVDMLMSSTKNTLFTCWCSNKFFRFFSIYSMACCVISDSVSAH